MSAAGTTRTFRTGARTAVPGRRAIAGRVCCAPGLTASRKPFLYFPLAHHFEQDYHARHRLDRYRAGRCMDYQTAEPADIAAAITTEISRQVNYHPVATDGAARAPSLLASLL
jgi:hypothetical protein